MGFYILKFASAVKRCHHFPIYHNKKGFTLLEIFIALSVIAVISATSIYYYTDYLDDARMAVRITNVKMLNNAINQYYKEHMTYPKYNWKSDDPKDLKNNINKGLDEALSKYFVNKKPSEILKESTNGKGFNIYYHVTKPNKKNRKIEEEPYENIDQTFNTGSWKMARNLRVETFDYLVNEIRVDDSGFAPTTFDNLETFYFQINYANSIHNPNEVSQYNSIPINKVLDIKMVCCPPGTFAMGAPTTELGKKNNENLHNVTITKQFLISKYEITQEQYEIVMGNNPSINKSSPQNPVENVTLQNALDFCEKLNTSYSRLVPYGYKFDLPTEAQWEYACRAGTTTAFNNNKNLTPNPTKPTEFLSDCPNAKEVAWFQKNSNNKTHPIGQKLPNNWGIYDMHGNVEELIKDLRSNKYPPYPPEDAVDPLVTAESITGTIERCHRGGGFTSTVDRIRSASRQGSGKGNKSNNVGFRVVLVSTDE